MIILNLGTTTKKQDVTKNENGIKFYKFVQPKTKALLHVKKHKMKRIML